MLAKFRKMTRGVVTAVLVAFVISIPLVWGAQCSEIQSRPSAVKINGEEIPFELFDRILNQHMAGAEEKSDTERRKLYVDAVDVMIREKLTLQEAKNRDLEPTADEIQRQIMQIYFRNPENGTIDQARFEQARKFSPVSEWQAIEEDIRYKMSLFKTMQSVSSGLILTPAAVREYFNVRYQRARIRHVLINPSTFVAPDRVQRHYAQHTDSYFVEERVKGRHVLFRIPEGASDEIKLAARSKALSAQIRLQSGLSFERLYAEAQKDTSGAVLAEELDWFNRGRMVPTFDTVAFHQPVGRVTDIIETQFGFHLALFDAHEFRRRKTLAEAEQEIRGELVGEAEIAAAKTLALELRRRIADGESLEAIARQHSTGKSASKGGLLGDVIPGELEPGLYPDSAVLKLIAEEIGMQAGQGRLIVDPEIGRLVWDLEENRLSDVIASSHGFHIVRIENRRGGDPALWKEKELQMNQEYRQNIKQQIYIDWARAMQKKSKIELHPSVQARMSGEPEAS